MLELFGKMCSRRFASPTTGKRRCGSYVDTASQECPSRDYDSPCTKTPSFQCLYSNHTSTVEQQACDRSLHRLEILVFLEKGAYGAAIESTITLRPGRPNRWSLTPVQHAELKHRQIGRASHDAAQGIHFPNDSALGHSANGWIARHLTNGFERTRHYQGTRATACSGNRGFGSRVAGPDDEHVVLGFEKGKRE
jgi:hypothetical protein